MDGVDVRAEGAGEAHPVHRLDAEVVHEEPAARVEGRLRELEVDTRTLETRARQLEEQLLKAQDARQEAEKRADGLRPSGILQRKIRGGSES